MIKNKILKLVISEITIIVIISSIIANNLISIATEELTDSGIDYTESIEKIKNPERGFYNTAMIKLKRENSETNNWYRNQLVQLKVDLSDFSGAMNNEQDAELTEEALTALAQTLENAKNNNNSIILRFIYDKDCDGIQNDEGLEENGGKRVEPSIEMIVRHIEQMKDIFYKYDNVIYNIQMGFFGAYGELHSTTMCKTENFNRTIDALLNNTPENVTISVRTPGQYCNWANVDINQIDKNITQKGEQAYRIGIFNDGYLGSGSDLGTYKNRNVEINWLNNQATHVPFGGEAIINYDNNAKLEGYDYMGYYSSMPNLDTEAFLTHTSYLNYEWNQNLHSDWKKTKYNGINQLYAESQKTDGTEISIYDYIENHLGYRLVLRDAKLSANVEQGKIFNENITIENVGFAPIIKDKKVKIIFIDNKEQIVYEQNVDMNVKDFTGGQSISKSLSIDLPENIEIGQYKVYLQIYSDILENNKVYLPIQLANNGIWNNEISANYIGTFNIVEKNTINENSKLDNIETDNINKSEKNKFNDITESNMKLPNAGGKDYLLLLIMFDVLIFLLYFIKIKVVEISKN